MPPKKIVYCSIPGCNNSNQELKLYNFPRNQELSSAWISCIQLRLPQTNISTFTDALSLKSKRICMKHFEKKFIVDSKRSALAYPTLFTVKEMNTGRPHQQLMLPRLNTDHSYAREISQVHNYAKLPTLSCVTLSGPGEDNTSQPCLKESINHGHRNNSVNDSDDYSANKEQEDEVEDSNSMQSSLENCNPVQRAKLVDYKAQLIFRNDLDDVQKASIFTKLIATRDILPEVANHPCLMTRVLTPKKLDNNGVFPLSIWNVYIKPKIVHLYKSRDTNVRICLLRNIEMYISEIDLELIKTEILPDILTAMMESDPNLVSATLMTLSKLVHILGPTSVIGGPRTGYFSKATVYERSDKLSEVILSEEKDDSAHETDNESFEEVSHKRKNDGITHTRVKMKKLDKTELKSGHTYKKTVDDSNNSESVDCIETEKHYAECDENTESISESKPQNKKSKEKKSTNNSSSIDEINLDEQDRDKILYYVDENVTNSGSAILIVGEDSADS